MKGKPYASDDQKVWTRFETTKGHSEKICVGAIWRAGRRDLSFSGQRTLNRKKKIGVYGERKEAKINKAACAEQHYSAQRPHRGKHIFV